MKDPYKLAMRFLASVFAFGTLLLISISVYAQNGPAIEKGLVRLKVTEALSAQLERAFFSKTTDGVLTTGIAHLDKFNRQYHVTEFKRIFRPGAKFEARHRRYGLHRWYELRIEAASPVLQAVSSYQSLLEVEKAEPVYKKAIVGSDKRNFGPKNVDAENYPSPGLEGSANDPMLANQWHYNNTGQTGGTAGADIRLFDAWKKETGKPEVIVAITDGGVDTRHPDLIDNLWINSDEVAGNGIDDDDNGFVDDVHGYSFVDDSGTIAPDDHGTHVAGTIAATTNNALGVAGVAGGTGNNDGIRVMSCATFSNFSAGGFAESYIYAADNGAVISQNSWGYLDPGVYELAVLEAIDYFIAEAGRDENGVQTGPIKGGLVIFSAGNSSSQEHYYPGYYAPTFAVASTTHRDSRAWYSNYGTWVDISAPGGETDAVEEEGVLSTLAGGQYGFFQGTSMACPHVSGAAALVISRYGKSGLTPDAVRERLRATSTPIDAANPAYVGRLGSGRLNANAALTDGDNTPPAAITDLSITKSEIGKITLSWTVPSDPGGFTAAYDIRYATSPITASNFNAAMRAPDPPAAKAAGETQEFTIGGLSGGTLYYFALKAMDFEGNISALSNVVSKTSELAPVIAVTPSSLTEHLQTAQQSSQSFTIRNTGPGPLTFTLINAVDEDDFAACDPAGGSLAPGASIVIRVSFDASNLLAGTYRKDLRIDSNDPEHSTIIIPLTLQVDNNNAPIASLRPEAIHFNSVQTGSSSTRTVTVHNAGSDPLIIHDISSTHPDFTTDVDGVLEVGPFDDKVIAISFSPSSTGQREDTLALNTNDPARPTLILTVSGEGLDVAPVTVAPTAIQEELALGTSTQRTIVLTNNGSFDRDFRMEVINRGVQMSSTPKTEDAQSSPSARLRPASESYQAPARPDPTSVSPEFLSWPRPVSETAIRQSGARQKTSTSVAAIQGDERYATGFEDFETGTIHDQQGWYASDGWFVEEVNPDNGEKHFRGSAITPGQTLVAISPMIFEEMPELSMFTATSMRINLDNSEGATWQILPEDPYSYVATRIRINPDKTIDVMSTDENYDVLWTRLDIVIPSGYFDLAVEHNGFGDGTSGFPTFDVYINGVKVFHGYNIAPYIGEVGFLCNTDTRGPVLDIDNFEVHAGEYIPRHITPSPTAGIIPAGRSVTVDLAIDGSSLKFGTYKSDIIAHIDEADEIIVPASVTITGTGSVTVSPYAIGGSGYPGELITLNEVLSLKNTGGTIVDYQIAFNTPGFSATPSSGTLNMRDAVDITINLDPAGFAPGIYRDTIKIITNLENEPIRYTPVSVSVWQEQAAFEAPSEVRMQVYQGEIGTYTFPVRNAGLGEVVFETHWYNENGVTIDPTSGTVGNEPREITITVDATNLDEGFGFRQGYWFTNDPGRNWQSFMIYYEVIPNTRNGSGTITREEWNNVEGKTVASIPVNAPPTSVTAMNRLEGAYAHGDNYGARIRGYIKAPKTGNYTFWIASDDHSELWLSMDREPANKRKIAYLTNYVDRGQYEKYPTQKSAEIWLQANAFYYIEVLHKEALGRDHLTVGWQLPDEVREFPIPGIRLYPVNFTGFENEMPVVTITSPTEDDAFLAPASVEITADATDADGQVVKVEFYNGNRRLGTDATAPYSYRWTNVPAGNYTLMAKAFDNLGAKDSAVVNVTVVDEFCSATGSILREVWTGIPGKLISSIPVNSPPSSASLITQLESPYNVGDNYGSRVRGYICVPSTGNYTFWVASDDHSELWLSTDDQPANKVKIASVTGYTLRRQWEKYPTQRSSPVRLHAGRKYYIEALQKEATGADHLSVGWQLPDGTLERPIAGSRLSPFTGDNAAPVVSITSPGNGDVVVAPGVITIHADASDIDGSIDKVIFYANASLLGEDNTAPYAFTWHNEEAGSHILEVKAIDKLGATGEASVTIEAVYRCEGSGSLVWDFWPAIPGTSIASIPLNHPPAMSTGITGFETPQFYANNYGARVSGYICVPQTGDYTFWISSDDNGELWLSTDNAPGNKQKIATVPGYTRYRQWDKYPSQQSSTVYLQAGYRYYIEALHKEANGNDHISVGWQLPDGTREMPIPGSRLSPGPEATSDRIRSGSISMNDKEPAHNMELSMFPNPARQGKLTLALFNASRDEFTNEARIEIASATGTVLYSESIKCERQCNEITIDLDGKFTPGVYVVKAIVNRKWYTKKLMVY